MRGVNATCEVIEIRRAVGWRQRNKQLGVIGVVQLIDSVKVGNAISRRNIDRKEKWFRVGTLGNAASGTCHSCTCDRWGVVTSYMNWASTIVEVIPKPGKSEVRNSKTSSEARQENVVSKRCTEIKGNNNAGFTRISGAGILSGVQRMEWLPR